MDDFEEEKNVVVKEKYLENVFYRLPLQKHHKIFLDILEYIGDCKSFKISGFQVT